MEIDPLKLYELFVQALRQLLGPNLSPLVLNTIAVIILGVGGLGLLALVAFLFSTIAITIPKTVEALKPFFYNSDEKKRSEDRRRFARHVGREIERLNDLEVWSDYRFAELEAEVEVEGRHRRWAWLPGLNLSHEGLRHEKSLSRALRLSQERLILLEGDPGSGKSVALRHIALELAGRAQRSRSTRNLVPLYINLKQLKRRRSLPIDRNLIEEYVLQTLNRANDRDIEQFLPEFTGKG